MQTHDDTKTHDNWSRPALRNTRRDFIKACGAVTAGSVTGLLLPGGAEAADLRESWQDLALQDRDDELFWTRVRRQFALKPGLVYMNTGTEGSMPRIVLARLQKYFREFTANPWHAIVEHENYSIFMTGVVERAAAFLGADPDEIVMTTNTTEGMAFVAHGLDLQEGDEVLTTMHFSPYNSCWQIVKDRKNITLTEVDLPTPARSKDEILRAFADAITPQTRVMCFCHINYTTGLRMPVRELCQLAHDRGIITLVDGAHAIGMLALDLHGLGCDFYACSPHKWLCAPPGTGVLYMRKDPQQLVTPMMSEVYPDAEGTLLFQVRGQQCTPAYTGIIDAIDFQDTIGKGVIENRITALSAYLKQEIVMNWGEASLFSPASEELSTGLVAFNPFVDNQYESYRPRTVGRTLRDEYDTVIRFIWFRDKRADAEDIRALRVSTHIYNNYQQIDSLIRAIKTIMDTI